VIQTSIWISNRLFKKSPQPGKVAVQGDASMPRWGYKAGYRRDLPHIQPLGATLFVTYRLAGSIPKHVARFYQARRGWLKEELRRLKREASSESSPEIANHLERLQEFERKWFQKFEEILHLQEIGPDWLKEEAFAGMIADSLHYCDRRVYELEAYCIMSNHVHAVFTPYVPENWVAADVWMNEPSDDSVLSTIMQSLKGYTARKCNQALGRKGQFWEHESYDHYVRNAGEFDRIVNYVLNNPVKAGLVDRWQNWRWSYSRQSDDVSQPFQVAET
jgi:REP element-mobilizing transposase RayT